MSTVVLPRPRALHGAEPTAAGKLAATLLSVTVAGITEPGRFRRGRAYVIERAVATLELDRGVLRAEVAGSQARPYRVQIGVAVIGAPPGMGAVPERAHIPRLVPDNDELDAWCDCPDSDSPCKHAAAALLAFADELQARPELLVAWRCATGDAPRAAIGSRADPASRHLRVVPNAEPSTRRATELARPSLASPFETPEWSEFVGTAAADPDEWVALVADLAPPGRGSRSVGRVDVGRLVASMTDAIARTLGGPQR